MTQDDLCLFALDASRPYGERVATALGLALCAMRNANSRTASTRPGRWKTCAAGTCT